MHKKILLFSYLLLILVFGASLTLAVNHPSDDECESEPDDCEDDCDDSGDGDGGDDGDDGGEKDSPSDGGCSQCITLGSFSLDIMVGTAPHELDVAGGRLSIHKYKPSPSLFTPQGLVFQDPLETFIGHTDTGARKVTIIRYNGKTLVYQFPSGSAIGYPTGEGRRNRSRLHMLDAADQPTAVMEDAVIYERTFPDGALIRYNVGNSLAEVLRRPSGREITLSTRGVEVIREMSGGVHAIRQIRGSRAFVDVRTDENDPYGYEIHLFGPDKAGTKNVEGLYEPIGTAHTIWRIENPNQSDTNLDEILVTKTAGTKSWQYAYEYSPAAEEWSLRQGDPNSDYRVERKTALSDSGWPNTEGARRTITRELFDGEPGTSNVLSHEVRTKEIFGWGPDTIEVVQDPNGLNLVTSYDYYTNSSETGRYARIKSIKYPDGRWTVFDYDQFGRKTLDKKGWLDAAFDSAPANARVFEYSYTAVDSADYDYGTAPVTEEDLTAFSRRPRVMVEKILGQEVSRTYYAYKAVAGEHVEIKERAATVGASYGTNGNLRTTRTFYSETAASDLRGRLKSVGYPDGREEYYNYSLSGGNLTVSMEERFSDGNGSYGLVDGNSIRLDRVIDSRGLEVERKSVVYAPAGFDESTPIEHRVSAFNEYAEVAERKRIDGANELVLYESTWANAQKDSETDQFGVTTTFTYNALQQVKTSTKEGLAASGNYPAQPDIVTTHNYDAVNPNCGCCTADSRRITVGGVVLETITKHDMGGRLLSQKDENGFLTSYSYDLGGRIVTKTLPSGATEVTEKYLDGQVKSVTGSSVVARHYDYGVEVDGSRYSITTTGPVASPRWEKTSLDVLGRVTRIEKPSFGTGNSIETYEYDADGRVSKISSPGKADRLFEYAQPGYLYRTGYKVDGAGSALVPASADRITEAEKLYVQNNGSWFRQETQWVYAADGSGAPTKINTRRNRLSGFAPGVLAESYELDAHDNIAATTITVDRTTKLATTETTVPGSAVAAKKISRNGLLQRENRTDFSEAVAYEHDAFGRQLKRIDPRTGATVIAYREFISDGTTYTGSLIAAETGPANDTTHYTYHESGAGAGQQSVREDPDGKKTNFTYNLRGQQTHAWGASYPVQYEYSPDYGWMSKQHTYRGGSGWQEPTWPLDPGTADTTTWHYQAKTGLLAAKEYADATKTEYTYHASGELETRKWARAAGGSPIVTNYAYWEDRGGELKKVGYSDSTQDVDYTYTRTGQIGMVTDAVGTRTFDYSTALELETEELVAGQTGLYSVLLTRKHQASGSGELPGRPAGISVGTTANPTSFYDATWHYDSAGRFARVQGPGLPAYGAEYAYLANARHIESVSYKTDAATSAASSTYTLLPNRDLVEVVENGAGSSSVSKYEYGYNSIGQRTSVQNSGSAFTELAHNMFDYNDRWEVIESKRFGGTLSAPAAEIISQRRDYLFDNIGNRQSHADGGGTAVSYTPNALNQYDAAGSDLHIHDVDGNLEDDGLNTYKWDGENRLVFVETFSGDTATFSYDYMGRRVRAVFDKQTEVVEERYVWDEWNLLMVLDSNNNPVQRFTWGLDIVEQASGLPRWGRPGAAAGGVGALLGVAEIAGSQAGDYIYFYDANGNVGQVFDWGSAIVSAHYEYDPFGRAIASRGNYTEINRFRFSTKYHDKATDLYYYGYRYYAPDLGRWINRDPIGERGGNNLYAIANNDTLNRWDYVGLSLPFPPPDIFPIPVPRPRPPRLPRPRLPRMCNPGETRETTIGLTVENCKPTPIEVDRVGIKTSIPACSVCDITGTIVLVCTEVRGFPVWVPGKPRISIKCKDCEECCSEHSDG